MTPIKLITGHAGIEVGLTCREVEYYHFMLDQHEVVFSEGLPTESFLVGNTIRKGMDERQLADYGNHDMTFPARPILKNFEVASLEELVA